MAEVVTIVTGVIPADRINEVTGPYNDAVKNGPPPTIEETFLLQGEGGRVAIVSVWHRRADVEATVVSGEEPFARRIIRAAGGTPEAAIYEIVTRAKGGAGHATTA